MSDDPARNLALSATDAEAMVDDLLKPERVQETEYVAQVSAIDVAEAVKYLHGQACPYDDQVADILETLLAENNALREHHDKMQRAAMMKDAGYPVEAYNYQTHIAVPREPTEAMWLAMGYDTYAAFIEDYRAMLRASEEEEG